MLQAHATSVDIAYAQCTTYACVLLRVFDTWQHSYHMWMPLKLLQGSIAVVCNWLKFEHTRVTDLIKDYTVAVSYVGLSTRTIASYTLTRRKGICTCTQLDLSALIRLQEQLQMSDQQVHMHWYIRKSTCMCLVTSAALTTHSSQQHSAMQTSFINIMLFKQ